MESMTFQQKLKKSQTSQLKYKNGYISVVLAIVLPTRHIGLKP
jgi:hypothetical protein